MKGIWRPLWITLTPTYYFECIYVTNAENTRIQYQSRWNFNSENRGWRNTPWVDEPSRLLSQAETRQLISMKVSTRTASQLRITKPLYNAKVEWLPNRIAHLEMLELFADVKHSVTVYVSLGLFTSSDRRTLGKRLPKRAWFSVNELVSAILILRVLYPRY